MSKWIKKGDQVIVISGNDKGIIGSVISRRGDRLVVQGVNVRKKHMRGKRQTQTSGIVELEGTIHISNVCLCNSEGKRVYLRVRQKNNGRKELYYKDGAKEIVHREIGKGKTA
jgi:large subunit ribosomal protein L24